MKVFALVALFVVAVWASPIEERLNKFAEFKLRHGKTYKNQEEESQRLAIFSAKLDDIEKHNALYEQGLVTYKKGTNQFSDWTRAEFEAYLTARKSRPALNTTRFVKTGIAVPDSVDWRTSGQVSSVKDQGQCGSCWSFSLTGAIESAYYRANGQSVLLSEQQLVDCTNGLNGNEGCDGGWLDETYPYIQQYGLQTEASYPYTATDGRCSYDASKVVVTVSNHVSIAKDEEALLEAVATVGPVSVLVDARYLDEYDSGVYSDRRCSPQELDHAVLVVGYGTQNGSPYWIVKNSWSEYWGEEGYFKLLRGSNECGVAEDDVYPILG